MNIKNFGEFVNEDIVKLRKLTFKSIIGFGNYKDITVQDMCNLHRHGELIDIYYNLGNIDFTDEVKKELCINERRSIKKPGTDKTARVFFKGEILDDIRANTKSRGENQNIGKKNKEAEIKVANSKNIRRDFKDTSKIRNQRRNQGLSF